MMNSKVIEQKLIKLSHSSFRSKFKLKMVDKNYITKIGLDGIEKHAYDFVEKRLAPLNNPKDGKQTPMRGHPVFIAQHATATCCRGCLQKWHHISKNKQLTDKDKDYIVTLIMTWIKINYSKGEKND